MENLNTILCRFPDDSIARVSFSNIVRDIGSGLHGTEYLTCVALDQANGQGARGAFRDHDKVVLV
jgi:hypothetical protein